MQIQNFKIENSACFLHKISLIISSSERLQKLVQARCVILKSKTKMGDILNVQIILGVIFYLEEPVRVASPTRINLEEP